MNAKLAKRLRKEAKAATEGYVPTAYIKNVKSSSIEVDPTTTKGAYRDMKRFAQKRHKK